LSVNPILRETFNQTMALSVIQVPKGSSCDRFGDHAQGRRIGPAQQHGTDLITCGSLLPCL
jgi:hypothetical protein